MSTSCSSRVVDLSWHLAGLSPQQGFLLSGAQASNYSVHYTQTSRYSIPAFNCRSSLRCSCIQLQWSLQLAGYSTVVTETGSSPTDGKVWMPQAQQDIREICANCPSMEKHLFFSSNCSPWMSCTSVPVDECNPVVSEWKRFQPRKGAISICPFSILKEKKYFKSSAMHLVHIFSDDVSHDWGERVVNMKNCVSSQESCK